MWSAPIRSIHAVALKNGQDGWLDSGEAQRRSLRVDEIVDLGELLGAL